MEDRREFARGGRRKEDVGLDYPTDLDDMSEEQLQEAQRTTGEDFKESIRRAILRSMER